MSKQISKLEKIDLYSILLFALYKLKGIKDYEILSQLIYIVDKDTLLKLCSQFGGKTIQIPTIKELKTAFDALELYYNNNIDKQKKQAPKTKSVETLYNILQDLMNDYKIK